MKKRWGKDAVEFVPTNCPSDLTDSQWEQIKEFFPQGPNSVHHKRSLINAVLYLVDNGCKWRALPHDFPPYSTVHTFYRRTRISGIWEKVLDIMVARTRERAGRKPGPNYALVDSQNLIAVAAHEKSKRFWLKIQKNENR